MISVIIPTHNRKDLLVRAVESVLNQTYKDFEIVIVADGCTDDTSKIVKNLKLRDSRIRFYEYHPAKGGNVARNIGIEKSRGEYIAFLDDDDEWLPNKLEKQLSLFQDDSEIGLVYTGVNIIYSTQNLEYSFIGKLSGDLSKEILLDNCIGTTSTVMVKRIIIEESGYFDLKLKALQDFDLWIRICQKCKIGVVQEKLINYYNYLGKKQVSAITQKYIDAFELINDKYKELYSNLNTEENKRKNINENMLIANKAMRNGDSNLARKYILRAMRYGINKKSLIYYCLTFTSFEFILKLRKLL